MLARKNLFEQPLRLSFSISGVALSVMLILVMWSVLQGVLSQAGAFVRNTDAQVWVVQRGFTDIAHGFSVVPGELREPLERIDGVRSASPITVATTEVPVDGGVDSLALIGYETEHGIGGPWEFATEPAVPEPGELVVDETFARTAGLGVGDELSLRGGSWEIVALSAGTNQFTSQLAFGALRDVRRLLPITDDANFYALQVEPGATSRVQEEIRERFPLVTPFSRATFIENNEREIREGFQPILYVMVVIAFIVGLAIVGLMMYTATTEKSREYGVLSAVGADGRQLAGVIVRQAAILAALGFALGCALLLPAGWLIGELAPTTELVSPWWLFALTGAAAIAMALLASVIPVRRLARLDPATVFRA